MQQQEVAPCGFFANFSEMAWNYNGILRIYLVSPSTFTSQRIITLAVKYERNG